MRTYLIDSEKNEKVIDLTKTKVHSSELVEFEFSTIVENKLVNTENVFVRKLAGQYFSSIDNKTWKKIARQDNPTLILNVDVVYNVYRGYKPSGLSVGAEGELLTQMPGKVVKILASIGDEVKKGQPLLILEAMKMENEIKSGMDGVLVGIHVEEGQTVETGLLLMEVEA